MVKQAFFLTNRFFHLYDFENLIKLKIDLFVILTPAMFEASQAYLHNFKQVFVLDAEASGISSRLGLKQTEQILIDNISDRQMARIICNDDVTMQTAGILRDRLSIPGPGEGICLRFSNKLFSKIALQGADVKIPKFEKFLFSRWKESLSQYFENLVGIYGLPFVIKPTNCASSLGLKIVSTFTDFKSLNIVESQDYEIEEFLQGRMLHCDSLIQDGQVIFSACSAYNQPMGNFLQGAPIGSIILPDNDEVVKKLKCFSEKVLHVLEHKNGASHLEVFEQDGEITFLEIAMRSPGGLAINAYKEAYNTSMLENDFLIQVGLEPNISTARLKDAFWMLYPCLAGRVIKKHEPQSSCEYHINWYCREGQVLSHSKSLSEISASVIGSAKTFSQAEICFKELEEAKIFDLESI